LFCGGGPKGNYPLLKEPYCKVCSHADVDTDACFSHADLYGFERIYALGTYNKEDNDLLSVHIRLFKDYMNYSYPLGEALGIAATEIYPELLSSDIIVPVPIHKDKLSERKFNQSLELCKIIESHLNKPVVEALNKTRNVSMRPLNRVERMFAVMGLYEVDENALRILEGTKILLIDDVVTSGFTVSECAKVLKTAGAKTVNVLAAGRTKGDN
jgi:predicted amidophosphoribosyltransferase